jgi:hypothetical protein
MKAKQIFTITALALAAGGAFAQQAAPTSRAEVKQEVLAARANGTLRHAGEAGPEEMTPYRAQVEAASTLTRAEGKNAVLQARAAHQLAHAGAVAPEEEMAYARAHPSTSAFTRAEVRLQVLDARANGTLIPAGQGEYAGASGTARRSTLAKWSAFADDNAVASRRD